MVFGSGTMDLELLTGLLLLLLLCSCGGGSQVAEQEAEAQEPERTILEMLHIDRVSVSHRQIRPHPYMRRLYQRLSALGLGGAGGTLVQSFRSVGGESAFLTSPPHPPSLLTDKRTCWAPQGPPGLLQAGSGST